MISLLDRVSRMVLLSAALLACGKEEPSPAAPSPDPPAPPPPVIGGIAVRIETQGDGPDADGYFLSIEGVPDKRAVRVNDSVFLALPGGVHWIRFEGVAPNCAVRPRPDPRIEIAGDRKLAPLDFRLGCSLPLPLTTPLDLTGGWRAVASEFFSDTTLTHSLGDVVASGLQGSLQIEWPHDAKEFSWTWRETYL